MIKYSHLFETENDMVGFPGCGVTRMHPGWMLSLFFSGVGFPDI